jgi:ABC-type multidrug transport system fused ATPase/permease subunit
VLYCAVVHYTWAAPLQLIIGMSLLILFLGYAAFAGVGIMIIMLPLSAFLSSQAASISNHMLQCTDHRLKLIGEVLRHIRIIKFYAWERQLLSEVEDVREKELKYLKQTLVWKAWSNVFLQAGPLLVSLVSFVVYTWIQEKPLTPDVAFTSIALFNIFRLPLMTLPRIFSLIFEADVSIERLSKYLALQDHTVDISLTPAGNEMPSADYAVDYASFHWGVSDNEKEEDDQVDGSLQNISVVIPKGKLTIVVGAVGSGKSTLLAALLHELRPTTGHVTTPVDNISYAAQSAYLVSNSVQDNILFGSTLKGSRLSRVVQCCELQDDLQLLPDGLQSDLGENGLNLSGGQKQRVSIARAVYPANQSIYILDDPLSALDAKVASRVFTQCFREGSQSLLTGQTRVLSTHALQYTKWADWIIVMDKMKVVQMGTYQQLTEDEPNGLLAQMLHLYLGNSGSPAQPSPEAARSSVDNSNNDVVEGSKSPLIQDETRVVGDLSWAVVLAYFRSCGLVWCIGAFSVLLSAQVAQLSTDLWLMRWTSATTTSVYQLSVYLSVYTYLSFITIILAFGGDLCSRYAGLR